MTIRVSFLLFLGAFGLAAFAQRFPIGTGELGPAIGQRFTLGVGSSNGGYLVAWKDGRLSWLTTDLFVARVDRSGRILDSEGVHVGKVSPYSPLRIASDGLNYLLLWSETGQGIRSVHVTPVSVSEQRTLAVTGSLLDLAWNGRHYVAILHKGESVVAVLLNPEGQVASGELKLPARTAFRLLACRRGECLIGVLQSPTGNTPGKPQVRAAVIASSGFPPIGSVADAPDMPVLFEAWQVGAIATKSDYVVVAGGRRDDGLEVPARITVRRFDRELRLRQQFESTDLLPPVVYDLQMLGADEDSVLIRYASLGATEYTVQLTRRGSRVEKLPPNVYRFMTAGPGGVFAAWNSFDQIVVSFPQRAGWTQEPALLSRSRAYERLPRVTAGSTSLLATWSELRESETLYARLLDRDGRPLTEPVTLAKAGVFVEALAAFDGVNYLVVWEQKADRYSASIVFGQFVSQDGTFVGERFRLRNYAQAGLGSLLWNGNEYAVTVASDLFHVGASGVVLNAMFVPVGGNAGYDAGSRLFIDYDPVTRRYRGVAGSIRRTSVAVLPNYFINYKSFSVPVDLTWTNGCCEMGDTVYGVWSDAAPAVRLPLFMTFDEINGFLLQPDEVKLPFPGTYPTRCTHCHEANGPTSSRAACSPATPRTGVS